MPARPVTRQAPPTLPLLERIRRGIIGDDEVMDGPYGPQRVVYADCTASGRSLDFVEDFVRDHVLPRYANSHTESSSTGLQTTRLGEDARRIILDAVGATEDDLVVFCGSGATAAVNKLVGILELRRLATAPPPPDERPMVFVGPYEHHSNELLRYAGRPLRIGSFSAASNVTGILTDTDRVARLLHAHGALSFWDYAAAAPYIPIRVAESAPGANDHKDAVFVSPHKFVGGPQTPGVLVVRREPVRNPVPTAPGGGTVSFVGPLGHRYLDDPVPARRAPPRPSSSPSAPGWSSPSNRPSGPRPSRPRRNATGATPCAAGTATPPSRSSATTKPAGCRSSPSASATCTTTTSSPCSTTSSTSRPAAAAPAPDPTATACSPSTPPPHTTYWTRSPSAATASNPAGSASTSTTSSATPSATTSSTPST